MLAAYHHLEQVLLLPSDIRLSQMTLLCDAELFDECALDAIAHRGGVWLLGNSIFLAKE